jgi:hypothetical protein
VFGGTKHSGYGREHAIATLQEFGYTKMIRFPSGTGAIPTWRGVTDVYDTAADHDHDRPGGPASPSVAASVRES